MPEAVRALYGRMLAGTATPEEQAMWAERKREQAEFLERMDLKQARFVRRLRKTWTWRGVAEECYLAWGNEARRIVWWEDLPGSPWYSPSHQEIGRMICEAAARRLGENPHAPPWN